MKAQEISALRAQTLGEGADGLIAAAAALRERLDSGGTVLALGNGGSATDAMDAVADLCAAPYGWAARRAIDLTQDPSILTAIGNDVGVDAIFQRQVIAHGRAGDALLAFSTSGGSANVTRALAEARERGLATVALVGYDGGAIADGGLADHVIATRSQSIPRIQEAQASAWHVLRELIEQDAGAAGARGDSDGV
jgi:D-sedoheptulose 7-phosphate isomerase